MQEMNEGQNQIDVAFPQTDASGDVDLDLLRYNLSLTPTERWRKHASALELVRALRKAGKEYYGRIAQSSQAVER